MDKVSGFVFCVIAFITFATVSVAHEESAESIEAAKIAEGGRLYDKWWQEYDLRKPTSTHPAYPSSGKKSGSTTWRCKECHGWDYRGKDGAYSNGSHYTGITGIRDYAGKSTAKVVSILKDNNHRYDSVMLDPALELLALFVTKGQVDTNKFVNDKTKKGRGEVEVGHHVFADKCVRCHGLEGNDINFGDSDEPEFVGTVASNNPWEAIHKIHNGHPGAQMGHMLMHRKASISERHYAGLIEPQEAMPIMRDKLSEEGIAHLLTYLQTLPTGKE